MGSFRALRARLKYFALEQADPQIQAGFPRRRAQNSITVRIVDDEQMPHTRKALDKFKG
jgi:hypothetical protein